MAGARGNGRRDGDGGDVPALADRLAPILADMRELCAEMRGIHPRSRHPRSAVTVAGVVGTRGGGGHQGDESRASVNCLAAMRYAMHCVIMGEPDTGSLDGFGLLAWCSREWISLKTSWAI